MSNYDVVIVGGGSAGCVLANRLSENSDVSVLLLEAGRRDHRWDFVVHMPAALSFGIGNKFYDWKYESEPEPGLEGRRVSHARGKILGGSSSINGMIFQRGNPADYERWAATPGCKEWSYSHCLPYFQRMETCLHGADRYRGDSGPLMLERGPASSPLFGAFFDAVREAGYELTEDVNGYRQEGFASFDRNIYRGRRNSASVAYLHPVASRPNLDVITRAHVKRLIFDGNKAVGVEFRKDRRNKIIKAGEIICCGGAINTPQLLQLSGVGPARTLEEADVKTLIDLPGVGENLQDHLEVYIQYACRKPVSMAPYLKVWRQPLVFLQWLLRKGPGSTNHFEAGGFVRGNERVKWPNLMFHFLPIAIRYDGSTPVSGHGYQFHVGPMFSDSRGSIKIKTNDPFEKPSIRFNYLSTEEDRKEWIEAVRVARNIMSQPAFEEFNGGEISPGSNVKNDDEILDWIKKDSETALHPSCSARMGTDHMAVVDPSSMRVHGTDQLRVVDASVMPNITNGNIYAPVMMLAEKAADLILGNTPLPIDDSPVYRHEGNKQK